MSQIAHGNPHAFVPLDETLRLQSSSYLINEDRYSVCLYEHFSLLLDIQSAPPNESRVSCYILYMDFLKRATRMIGAIFTKLTIREIFYAKE
jgi:hypothetical protein